VRFESVEAHIRTLYIFNTFGLVGGLLYGLYYGVFLYKNTFSLSILALDGLLGGFGLWLGYLIGVACIKRAGYGRTIKLAFGLFAAVALLTATLANHIADYFIVLAVLRTLPAGIYLAVGDTILLRDVHASARAGFLQLKLAFEFIAGIILPTLIGAMIKLSGSYHLAFILAALIYIAALFVPIRLPNPVLRFNFKDLYRLFKRPFYTHQVANRTLSAGFNQVNGFVIMIIPFLMLKNEMNVGLLVSATALLSAGMSLYARRLRNHQTLRYGYSAYAVRAAAGVAFIAFWSAPVLLVWQLINKLMTPLHDPLQQRLDIENDQLILGEDVRGQALTISLVNSTLLLIGTTAAYGAFFFITKAVSGDQRLVLQLMIGGFAAWRFINLAITVWINRKAKDPAAEVPVFDHVGWRVGIKRFANIHAMRLVYLFAR
jgi:hypothetical protein